MIFNLHMVPGQFSVYSQVKDSILGVEMSGRLEFFGWLFHLGSQTIVILPSLARERKIPAIRELVPWLMKLWVFPGNRGLFSEMPSDLVCLCCQDACFWQATGGKRLLERESWCPQNDTKPPLFNSYSVQKKFYPKSKGLDNLTNRSI